MRQQTMAGVPRLCALVLLAAGCSAWPSGAPADACGHMTPGHGQEPQLTPMPYGVSTSNDTVLPGNRMTVTISRDQQPPFRGFFVQVRDAAAPAGAPPLGQFFTRSHSLVSCGTDRNNGISHSDSKGKEAVTLLWQAPPALDADSVVFRVTVVQEHDIYWVARDSAPLRVVRAAEVPPQAALPGPEPTSQDSAPEPKSSEEEPAPSAAPPPPSTPASTPASTTASTTARTTVGTSAAPVRTAGNAAPVSSLATAYDSCLLSKGCFTRANSCIEGRNCDLMVTYQLTDDGRYRLQLYGKHETPGYLALGLSHDKSMGDDAVVYCTDGENGGYQVRHAVNQDGAKVSLQEEANSAEGELVSDFHSEYQDGFLLCEFSHAARFSVGAKEVDLSSSDLHVMVASGPASLDHSPQYHQAARRVSAEPVVLSSARGAAGESNLLFRLHGALMIAAWIGTASVGMLVARYYKHTWVGRQLAGLDLWFQGHRALMVLTVLLTVAALVCVALQLGGWTRTPLMGGPEASPHPLLGILCVALALLQPLMALCRCHPGTPRRSVFNWLHWMVGSAAHNLGIAAIFFAVKLPQAQLPGWTFWVLAAFVVFHVCVHLLLSMQACWSDRTQSRQKSQGEAYNMRDMGLNGYHAYQVDRPQEASGSTLRRTVLGIYVVINILFVALLVLMVVLAPADKWMEKLIS